MKQYFLVIYSDISDTRKTKLNNFFESAREIFSNVFVCTLEDDTIKTCEDVRSKLLDIEDILLMVIRLDADFSSAWYISQDASDYLKSIFNIIHHGTK